MMTLGDLFTLVALVGILFAPIYIVEVIHEWKVNREIRREKAL